MSFELNIDGLVGPTHNYAGLSRGNIASDANRGKRSDPRAAALQGLKKMRTLMELGVPQAVMPPHERPFLPVLRDLGFQGTDKNLIAAAWETDPTLVANLSSASAMWTANAATVGADFDSRSGKTHFSPANLVAMAHRSVEPQTTRRLLKAIFRDETRFAVHDALPSNTVFGDEGAANHNRMAARHGTVGLQIFVHGRSALNPTGRASKFPERQTLEASQAIARRHQIYDDSVLHVRQNPAAIDAGAFHNDVVCVANEAVLLFHEHAFEDRESVMAQIRASADHLGFEPCFLIARDEVLSLENAVRSYLFNSQLVTLPSGGMALILPVDADENAEARQFAQDCLDGDNPIEALHFLDLRQSMRNGGGPACLRLRVPLPDADLSAVHQPVLMNPDRLLQLDQWVRKHYRDRLDPNDLGDPELLVEAQAALDELTGILGLGNFYHFQHKDHASWLAWD